MTDQPRRQSRSQSAARPMGEPNVLSDQATPNTLSTMGRPTAGITAAAAPANGGARPGVVRAATAPPPTSNRRPAARAGKAAAPDDHFVRPRRRPTLGTLIFIGFVIVWAARLFNGAGIGSDGGCPTLTPRPTIAPHVTFAPSSPTASPTTNPKPTVHPT